jgi:hypothetical protein
MIGGSDDVASISNGDGKPSNASQKRVHHQKEPIQEGPFQRIELQDNLLLVYKNVNFEAPNTIISVMDNMDLDKNVLVGKIFVGLGRPMAMSNRPHVHRRTKLHHAILKTLINKNTIRRHSRRQTTYGCKGSTTFFYTVYSKGFFQNSYIQYILWTGC